jgi:hypothetical protein
MMRKPKLLALQIWRWWLNFDLTVALSTGRNPKDVSRLMHKTIDCDMKILKLTITGKR